jgi:hypothetical protein
MPPSARSGAKVRGNLKKLAVDAIEMPFVLIEYGGLGGPGLNPCAE